jgi:hypothetical protein
MRWSRRYLHGGEQVMMLFKRFLIDAILAGEKTETRRIWAKCRVKVGSIHQVQPDLRSSFQKAPPPCRIKILSTHLERLFDITAESVRHEGFPSGNVHEFIAGFKDINGQKAKIKNLVPDGVSWNDWNPELWVIRFKIYHESKTQKLF